MDITIKITVNSLRCLTDFLDNHESGIAHGVKDYGKLLNIYHNLYEIYPKKKGNCIYKCDDCGHTLPYGNLFIKGCPECKSGELKAQ